MSDELATMVPVVHHARSIGGHHVGMSSATAA